MAWTLTIGIFLWIASALSPVPLQAAISGTYITTADVSLRSGPGVSYPVLTTLPRGIKIKVVGREDYWLKVESKHGDASGYIDEQFAAPEGSTETSTTTPPPPTGAYRTLVTWSFARDLERATRSWRGFRPASKLMWFAPRAIGSASNPSTAANPAISREDSWSAGPKISVLRIVRRKDKARDENF